MENYINAEIEILPLSSVDTLSASIPLEPGENELPIDRFAIL